MSSFVSNQFYYHGIQAIAAAIDNANCRAKIKHNNQVINAYGADLDSLGIQLWRSEATDDSIHWEVKDKNGKLLTDPFDSQVSALTWLVQYVMERDQVGATDLT